MKTYCGWTAEEIQEAEAEGWFIPSAVWIDYMNGDTDEDNELENALYPRGED